VTWLVRVLRWTRSLKKRQHEHCEGGDNAPDEVVAARAHPSSSSMCEGGVEAVRRGGSPRQAGSGEQRGRVGLLQHRGRRQW
jgi:hypothetical protein